LAVPLLEAALFVPLVIANPRRMTRQNRWLRNLSIALVLLIAATNAGSLILLTLAFSAGLRMAHPAEPTPVDQTPIRHRWFAGLTSLGSRAACGGLVICGRRCAPSSTTHRWDERSRTRREL
jgi:hypothetical protein